jgi:ATP-binding cassette subfamily G (WHITE) protein 2
MVWCCDAGLYYDLDLGPSGIQNRIGAFFLLVMIFTFSNISVLELFIEERALYFNEKSGGFYR